LIQMINDKFSKFEQFPQEFGHIISLFLCSPNMVTSKLLAIVYLNNS